MVKSTRLIKIVSVVLMITLLLGVLISCDNNDKQPSYDTEFNTAANALKVAIFNAKDANWSIDMSAEVLSPMPNSGEYIMYEGVINFLLDSLKKADILPAQIDSITELFQKQEVKDLFNQSTDKENENTKSKNFLKVLLPMLKSKFSKVNIGNVLYQILYDLSSNADELFNSIYLRGLEIVNVKSHVPNSELNKVGALSLQISNYYKCNKEKNYNKFMSDIENAKPGIKTLGEFIYDVSFDSIYTELDLGNKGALSEINEGEIKNVLTSLLVNFKDFKQVFTDEQLNYTNIAIKEILDKFSGILLCDNVFTDASKILNDLFEALNISYMALDLIPSICDFVISSESLIENDSSFVNDVFKLLTDEAYNVDINKNIIFAKMLLNDIKQSGVNVSAQKDFMVNKVNDFDSKLTNYLPYIRNDKKVGLVTLNSIVHLIKMNAGKSYTEEEQTEFVDMGFTAYCYDLYKGFLADLNAANAGVVCRDGDQYVGKPYKALFDKFSNVYMYIVNFLGAESFIPNDNTETEYQRILYAYKDEIADKFFGQSGEHGKMQIWYTKTKNSMFSDINNLFENYDVLVNLASCTFLTNDEAIGTNAKYVEMKKLSDKLYMPFEYLKKL